MKATALPEEQNQANLGVAQSKPWYELFPSRFRNDKELVKRHYPFLKWRIEKKKKAAFLEGNFPITRDNLLLGDFELRIVFPDSYPNWYPTVYEIGGRIPRELDRHVSADGSLCFFLPEAGEIDLLSGDGLIKFLDKLSLFLLNQLIFEVDGKWAIKEWRHGIDGQLQFYREKFGLNNKDGLIPLILALAGKNKIGRNDKCPCNSNVKYKKCHLFKVEDLKREVPKSRVENLVADLIRQVN